jgi:membrane-associated phospholipid phosphatase
MHPKTLAWATAVTATACALGMTAATGLRIEPSHGLMWTAGIGLLVAIQAFYTRYRPEPLIADLIGTLAVNLCASCMIGVVALAGLAVNAPLVDGALIRADAMLGLDARAMVETVSHWTVLHGPLAFAYQFSVVLLVFAPSILVVLRRAEAAWRFCAMIGLSGLACALLSIPFPAIGAFPGLQIPDDVVTRLLEGAGLYHIPTFDAFRSGLATVIRLSELNGVITFPSFHAAFACATAHAFLPVRPLRLPVVVWTVVVMASTMVIGGHYFVDVLAGLALFAAVASVARPHRTASRPPRMAPAMTSAA